MRRSMIVCLFLAAAACRTTATDVDAPTWQPVRFLIGAWRSEAASSAGRSVHEEVWTPPHGDTMYGQNRTLEAGKLRFFELLTIERRGLQLVYVARPRGGAATEFVMSDYDDDSVTFTNVNHDFPKRLRYRRAATGELRATADDGTDDGKRLEFVWRAVR